MLVRHCNKIGKLACFACLLFMPMALAEYRVYQYVVASADRPSESYLQLSTLSPVSFKSYHGQQTIKIQLLNSWMCMGATGGEDYCPSPMSKIHDQIRKEQSVQEQPI